MARSMRGAATAVVGREERVNGPPPGYRFLLPTLPADEGMRLCVFLHGDTTKRPYRVEDFRQPLEDAGVLKDVNGIGAYQMSHLWLVRFRTQEAKDALVEAGGMMVKGGYCAVVDPCRKEIRLKVHWVPFHIPSETLRKALSEFGEVAEVRHEEWNVPGFESAESTTRVARMVLKEGVTAEELPHLFKFYGGSVLVVVPGRAPVCLRCRRRGHIRRDCQIPRCTKCRAFGHVREDCVRTYASVTGKACEESEDKEDIMDIEEAETMAPHDRRENNASDEQPERIGAAAGVASTKETPKEQGTVGSETGTPSTNEVATKNAEAEPSSQGESGSAKRAKLGVPASSQPSNVDGSQSLERQWLKATGTKGKYVMETRSASASPVRSARRTN